MPHRVKRSWTDAQKKQCAAKASWRCGRCSQLLPSSFEIDHVTPLFRGGADDIDTNAMALCPNCHRHKTQEENIERTHMRRQRAVEAHEQAELEWANSRRLELSRQVDRQVAILRDGSMQCAACTAKYYPIFRHKCPHIERTLAAERANRQAKGPRKRPRAKEAMACTEFDRFLCI